MMVCFANPLLKFHRPVHRAGMATRFLLGKAVASPAVP